MSTAREVAREYFPRASDEELENIIWGQTGFPAFWCIPEGGKTPEECFRNQLASVKKYGRHCIRCGWHGTKRHPLRGELCRKCVRIMKQECAK